MGSVPDYSHGQCPGLFPDYSLAAHPAVIGDLAYGQVLDLIQLKHAGGKFIINHGILPDIVSEEARVIRSRRTGYRVLYHALCDPTGGKFSAGKASQGYLVLYHRKTSHRQPENQLQHWLCGWHLVLYHLGDRQTLLLAPFLDIGVAAGKVTAGSLSIPPGTFR